MTEVSTKPVNGHTVLSEEILAWNWGEVCCTCNILAGQITALLGKPANNKVRNINRDCAVNDGNKENVRSYGVGKIGSVNDTTHRAYSLVFKCGKVLPQGERREQAAEEFTGALLPTNNKLALRW